MTDVSSFQTQGSAARSVPIFFIKDAKTGAISETEIPRNQFAAPLDGSYKLRLFGMTAPFEMDGQYGKSKNVRCAFVVRAPGTPAHNKMFSQLLSVAKVSKNGDWYSTITAKSAIGQMIGAIRGKPIEDGEPINLLDYLNGEFNALVVQEPVITGLGTEIFGRVVKDSWKPAQEAAAGTTHVSPPEPAAPNPLLDGLDD